MVALRLAGLALSVSLFLPACAVAEQDAAEDVVAADASELRALLPEEVLGELAYGDARSIPYTAEPRYRAYSFTGTKGDWLDVRVSSSTGSIAAFVTDDQFRSIRRGTRGVLPRNGRYFIAVREGDLQPATIEIQLLRRPLPATP